MSIYVTPNPLLEAVLQVTNTTWRRDLDIRPLVLVAGLYRSHLTEVYSSNPEEFESRDSDSSKLHKLLTVPKISDNAAFSLRHYSEDGSMDINHHLWNHYSTGSDIPTGVATHIDRLKTILKPSTPVERATLYTGVARSPANTAGFEWNSTRPIKILHLPAFTSSTTNFDVAESFAAPDNVTNHHESDHHGTILPGAKHIIQLSFHKNIPNAASIVNHSENPHEEEVLLGPNHRFELHPRPTKVDGPEGPIYVWKAKSIGVDDRHMFVPRIRSSTK